MTKNNFVSGILRQIDKKYNKGFFNYSIKNGYITKKQNKITAVYWLAMVETTLLRITQQRINNKFLTAYFGKRIVVSEREIAKLSDEYMPYMKYELTDLNGCLVTVCNRKISELIKFRFSKLTQRDILKGVKKMSYA